MRLAIAGDPRVSRDGAKFVAAGERGGSGAGARAGAAAGGAGGGASALRARAGPRARRTDQAARRRRPGAPPYQHCSYRSSVLNATRGVTDLHAVAVLRRGHRGVVPVVGGRDAAAARKGRAPRARRAAAAPLPLRHAVTAAL